MLLLAFAGLLVAFEFVVLVVAGFDVGLFAGPFFPSTSGSGVGDAFVFAEEELVLVFDSLDFSVSDFSEPLRE